MLVERAYINYQDAEEAGRRTDAIVTIDNKWQVSILLFNILSSVV